MAPTKGVDSIKLTKLTLTEISRANNDWVDTCTKGAVMCCWNAGVAAGNTDVCDTRVANDKIHCHGTVIRPGQLRLAQFAMSYIQMKDHLQQRGYSGSVAGYNACDCLENMPIITRADVSLVNDNNLKLTADGKFDQTAASNFNAGTGNDLLNTFKTVYPGQPLPVANLVGACKSRSAVAGLFTKNA